MKKILAVLFLTFISHTGTFGCLNGESKELKDGTLLYMDLEGNVPYGHNFDSDEHFLLTIKRLDSLYIATKDLDYLSDKGLLLILLRKYDEAIKLYLEIEKITPNRYSTASNIGTAYELVGQNENALKWLKKAVKIDPTSHYGSEWIHVKILEAKLKGEQFYNANFILGTDFGTEPYPKSSLKKDELKKLSTVLYYQLNERISFVEPEEKIVAALLFELGNIAFLNLDFSDAIADYQEAKKYGFTEQLINDRITAVSKFSPAPKIIQRKTVSIGNRPNYFLWGSIGLSLCAFVSIIIFVRKRKKVG